MALQKEKLQLNELIEKVIRSNELKVIEKKGRLDVDLTAAQSRSLPDFVGHTFHRSAGVLADGGFQAFPSRSRGSLA